MIRWIRILAVGTLILALLALGIGVGLFLVANGRWVLVAVPDWLRGVAGGVDVDLWLPGLLAGWLLAVLAVSGLLIWSMYYVWRRRQYESLIARLESELARLRNLPMNQPAPLEDLPAALADEQDRWEDESASSLGAGQGA